MNKTRAKHKVWLLFVENPLVLKWDTTVTKTHTGDPTWAGLMSWDTRESECQVGQQINVDASVLVYFFFNVSFLRQTLDDPPQAPESGLAKITGQCSLSAFHSCQQRIFSSSRCWITRRTASTSHVHEDDWFNRKNSINQSNYTTGLQQNFVIHRPLKKECAEWLQSCKGLLSLKGLNMGSRDTSIWREVMLTLMTLQSRTEWVFWTLSHNSHLYMPTCSQATQLTGQLTDQSFICLQETQPQGSLLKDESADSDKNMTKANFQNWEMILLCSYLVFLSQQTIHQIIHFVIWYLPTCQHVFFVSRPRTQLKYIVTLGLVQLGQGQCHVMTLRS